MTNFNENGFSLRIILHGNEQKILNGNIVLIPFNEEYAVMVRNNNDRRAQFSLSIDGYDSGDKFVLDAYSSMTIERFLNGNLNYGNKFKFVKENNEKVARPGNSQNGIIKVTCQLEKVKEKIVYVNTWPRYDWDWYHIYPMNSNYNYIGCQAQSRGFKDTLLSAKQPETINYTCNFETGATIEGSKSEQKFTNVSGFELEDKHTVLQLQLKAFQETLKSEKQVLFVPSHIKYCNYCGYGYDSLDTNNKFCKNCGNKLS